MPFREYQPRRFTTIRQTVRMGRRAVRMAVDEAANAVTGHCGDHCVGIDVHDGPRFAGSLFAAGSAHLAGDGLSFRQWFGQQSCLPCRVTHRLAGALPAACAKKAEASLRISLVRRSSRFSRTS